MYYNRPPIDELAAALRAYLKIDCQLSAAQVDMRVTDLHDTYLVQGWAFKALQFALSMHPTDKPADLVKLADKHDVAIAKKLLAEELKLTTIRNPFDRQMLESAFDIFLILEEGHTCDVYALYEELIKAVRGNHHFGGLTFRQAVSHYYRFYPIAFTELEELVHAKLTKEVCRAISICPPDVTSGLDDFQSSVNVLLQQVVAYVASHSGNHTIQVGVTLHGPRHSWRGDSIAHISSDAVHHTTRRDGAPTTRLSETIVLAEGSL